MERFPNSKGVGIFPASASSARIGWNWNILKQDVSLPAACLSSRKLVNNIRWMEEFLTGYPTAKLAPHGKTSMCPKLFHMQLQAKGTWGITLATTQQVQVAANHGVKNVVLANQLVGRTNMEIVANIMKLDPGFRFMCIVDSVQGLQVLGAFFQERGLKLDVLVEIGTPENGRTGLRNVEQLKPVLEELGKWRSTIQLVGIEFFEGVLKTAEAVRGFLRGNVVQILESLFALEVSPFAHDEIILSGAGSSFFDVVAEELSRIELPPEFLRRTKRKHTLSILLRAGCYLTQDVGGYKEAQKRMKATNPVVAAMKSSLEPALQIWAYVTSKPEPGLAIVGMGRRDVSFDSGMPEPSKYLAINSKELPVAVDVSGRRWVVTNLMDQHAFMRIDTSIDAGRKEFDALAVGDMISFDIRHPCTTFDKWRTVLLIDDDYNVLDVLETYF